LSVFFLAFGLIFFAELGDKSQLVALWFSTRYRWWLVLLGVTAATLVVHLGSTALGASASDVLPEPAVLVLVGLSFYAFALWGLRGDTIDEASSVRGTSRFGAFGLIASAFFISELGDKTQLATISIASDRHDFVAVWLGSTFGMVTADALAIAVGVFARGRIPEKAAAMVAGALFAVFGTIAIAKAVVLLVD
jgi:putative Ca2+/H+ antiporter (TMEM165/GDT1 family)